RTAEAYSYVNGNKMERLSEDQIIDRILVQFKSKPVNVLAPVVKGRKGHYRELFEQIRKQGYVKVRIDGELVDLRPKLQVDRYKTHDIEIVIDRLEVTQGNKKRLQASVQQAMKLAKGIIKLTDAENNEYFYSRFLMHPESGFSYDVPQPNSFSFKSPYGACLHISGLGYI